MWLFEFLHFYVTFKIPAAPSFSFLCSYTVKYCMILILLACDFSLGDFFFTWIDGHFI